MYLLKHSWGWYFKCTFKKLHSKELIWVLLLADKLFLGVAETNKSTLPVMYAYHRVLYEEMPLRSFPSLGTLGKEPMFDLSILCSCVTYKMFC